MFIPSPVSVGTLLREVPWTPMGASFFKFELKPTGKDSADPTQSDEVPGHTKLIFKHFVPGQEFCVITLGAEKLSLSNMS